MRAIVSQLVAPIVEPVDVTEVNADDGTRKEFNWMQSHYGAGTYCGMRCPEEPLEVQPKRTVG